MAISHVFSNAIPDGTNTNIVRPSDWNSAHNQYYTLSGNTLGASTVSGTNVVLQGGGNVSLSGTGQTVVVYGGGGGVGGGVAIGASTQTATSGTVVFSNSNGISFGLNNGTLTASAAAAPTAYVSSVNGSSGAVTVAGTGTSATNASITLNSNGLAVSVAAPPTAYVSSLNGNSGALSLAVGSSLSSSVVGSTTTFGLATNISTYLQTAGNYLTTARASNDAIGLNTAQTNVTWTVNSSGLSINASGYAGTGTSATNASITLNSNGLAISVAAPGGGGNFSAGVSNLGNTVGSTGITGTRVVFVGTNVISLSQSTDANGGTISISAPATSSLSSGNNISISSNGSTIGISALALGLNTAATNVTWTANSSGLSINASGYAGTGTSATNASVTLNSNGLAISVAAPGAANYSIGVSNLGNTAGSTGITGTRIAFVGTNNISLSQSTDANGATISINHTGAAGPTAYVSSLNGNSGALSLAVGSSLSSSVVGSTTTLGLATDITTALQSANANYLTSQSNQAFSASGGSTTFQTLNFANSNGVTFSNSNGSVVAAYSVPTITSWTVSDSATSGTVGRLAFTNLNGVTLSLSTGAAGSHTIVGSHNGLTSQSNQAFSASGGSSAFQTLNFANTNGVTFSNSNGSVQITHDLQYTSNTSAITANALNTSVSRVINIVAATNNAGAGTASLSGNVSFTNANGLTFYTSAGGAIAGSHNGLTSQSVQTQASGNIAGVGFTSTTTTGTAITASLGTNGLSMAVPLYLTAAGGGNFSAGVSNLGNTAGSTGVSGSRIVFVGTNNISLSQSTDANGATISINQTGGAGGGNAIGISGGANSGTGAAGTVYLATGNGISFGFDAASSQITASYAFIVTDSATSEAVRRLAFSNSNGVSFGLSTGLGASATITASHNGLTNINVSAGTAANNLSNIVFSNSNNVSFGLNGSTVTASASDNGGVYAGVSNLNANTAGSTGVVSTGNVVFAGVNNITLSQSTGAPGSAATISIIGEPPTKSWAYPNPNNLTFVSNHVNASASINMIQVPFDISGTRMDILMYQSLSSSAAANTYAQAWSIYMGIYSNDTAASRIYSLSSGSTQTTYSNASNTAGVTQIIGSGVRPISCPINFTMSEGQYAVVANWVTTASSIGAATTALNQTLSVVGNPIQSASMAIVPEYDVVTGATNRFTYPMGMLNVASTGIPASISYSQINMTGLSLLRANFFVVMRG